VNNDRYPIGGQLNIQLDSIRAQLDRKGECGQRILGRQSRGPAVRNDQRPGAGPVRPRFFQSGRHDSDDRNRPPGRQLVPPLAQLAQPYLTDALTFAAAAFLDF
jgi:hypothetical protein